MPTRMPPARHWLVAVTGVLAAVIFLVDLMFPIGVAVPLLYAGLV